MSTTSKAQSALTLVGSHFDSKQSHRPTTGIEIKRAQKTNQASRTANRDDDFRADAGRSRVRSRKAEGTCDRIERSNERSEITQRQKRKRAGVQNIHVVVVRAHV